MSFPEYIFNYSFDCDVVICYELKEIIKDDRESFSERIDKGLYKKIKNTKSYSYPKTYCLSIDDVDSFCFSFDECLQLRKEYFLKEISRVNKEKMELEKLLNKKIKNPLLTKEEELVKEKEENEIRKLRFDRGKMDGERGSIPAEASEAYLDGFVTGRRNFKPKEEF